MSFLTSRLQAIALAILALFFSTLSADALTRRCEGLYRWETTGGSIGGSFTFFTSLGTCGDAVPNRCRIRARQAAERCIRTHWETRWDRRTPEACLNAAGISNYDTSLSCYVRTDGVGREGCLFDRPGAAPIQNPSPVIVRSGDLKGLLEAQVCCAYRNGEHQFPNPGDVRVRLSYETKGQTDHCQASGVLSNDYGIDCAKVRREVCMWRQ